MRDRETLINGRSKIFLFFKWSRATLESIFSLNQLFFIVGFRETSLNGRRKLLKYSKAPLIKHNLNKA